MLVALLVSQAVLVTVLVGLGAILWVQHRRIRDMAIYIGRLTDWLDDEDPEDSEIEEVSSSHRGLALVKAALPTDDLS